MENKSSSATGIKELRQKVEDRRHKFLRIWDKDFGPGLRESIQANSWITGLAAGAILVLSNALLGSHVAIPDNYLRGTLAAGFAAFVLTVILGVVARLAMLHVFAARILIGYIHSKGKSAQDQDWLDFDTEIEGHSEKSKTVLKIASLCIAGTILSFALGIILTSIVMAVMFF